MKANELMIGDWLRVSDVPTNLESKIGKCGKVAKLEQYHNYSGIAIKCDNELDTYFCEKEEELEPIPLTPEILEKNGFYSRVQDLVEKIKRYFLTEVFLELEESYDHSSFWLCASNVLITRIKYVHELQHFLRLVGVKKEIVL